MRNEVIIRFQVEGFHNYPTAPKEVKFLQFPHRHDFDITMGFKVEGLNREIEIFIMRKKVIAWFDNQWGTPCQFGPMSCEHIASALLMEFEKDGCRWASVWEEGTGGSRAFLDLP